MKGKCRIFHLRVKLPWKFNIATWDTRVQLAWFPKYFALVCALLNLCFTPKYGGRGIKSVKEEYKLYKIKTALKLYSNSDPAMQMVTGYEENTV